MKKGKTGWILLVVFTAWAALITGCGKWPGNRPEKEPEETTTPLPKIQELTYYMHGTMMETIWSVSLIRQGEEALVRVEPWDKEEEEFYDYPAEAELLEKARGFWRPMTWRPGPASAEGIPMSQMDIP